MSEKKKSDLNFNQVQKMTPKEIFWPFGETVAFEKRHGYKHTSYHKFDMIMTNWYTVKYSMRLSRNAWLMFCWLKILVFEDGFVHDSYENIMEVYGKNGGQKISKPTFFKCIEELENLDLITTIRDKPKGKMKGCNIYCLVDKSLIIHKICLAVDFEKDVSIAEAIRLSEVKKKTLFDLSTERVNKVPEPPAKKKKIVLPDDKKYRLMMAVFKKINKEIEEFFEFIGSYNKSGHIAITRKIKILRVMLHYYNDGWFLEDFTYAMNLTMRNTKKGTNPYRERYMFKILANMAEPEDENGEEIVNEVAERLSKKAEEKLAPNKPKQKQKPPYNPNYALTAPIGTVLNRDIYEKEKAAMLKGGSQTSNAYKEIMYKYEWATDKYGAHLYKIAKAIERKYEVHSVFDNENDYEARHDCLKKYGYYEKEEYDDMWNRIYSYYRSTDYNNPDDYDEYGDLLPDEQIDSQIAIDLFKKHKVTFYLSKYDSVEGCDKFAGLEFKRKNKQAEEQFA